MPLAKMATDGLWPVLFLITISACIGILACLTFTVFSIIFERRAVDGETQRRHVAGDDSPVESYCTLERSFNGPFDDNASVNGQKRASITPKKSPKQQKGKRLQAATVRRDFRSNQSGIQVER